MSPPEPVQRVHPDDGQHPLASSAARAHQPPRSPAFVPPNSSEARLIQRFDVQQEVIKTTPRFFSLPAELREMVFGFLWYGWYTTISYQNTRFRAVYGRVLRDIGKAYSYIDQTEGGLPLWLLVNKQLLHETMDNFHKHAVFFPLDLSSLPPLRTLTYPYTAALEQARIVGSSFFEGKIFGIIEPGQDTCSTIGFTPKYEAILTQMIQCLCTRTTIGATQSSPPPLQILQMGILIRLQEFDEIPKDFEFRLDNFEKLPRSLKKVIFNVDMMRGGSAMPLRNSALPSQIQHAISRTFQDISLLLVSSKPESVQKNTCHMHGLIEKFDYCPMCDRRSFMVRWSCMTTSVE